ncbi:MAG: ribosomal-processing cysteine protease Prp [Oscillospiraceae bacterium]|jgi:uncharacterized protein YsxB (DUF464 family)|nr:ribosomal-processing cysteine protease Prp [Oscillospiraceae bacterium]
MTQITVYVTRRKRITGYTALGHTLYADAGEDIVCAGVSALTQSTVIALRRVARVTPRVVRKPGLLIVRVAKTSGMRRHDAQIILLSCVRGLEQIAGQFPLYARVRWKLDDVDQTGYEKRKEGDYDKILTGFGAEPQSIPGRRRLDRRPDGH